MACEHTLPSDMGYGMKLEAETDEQFCHGCGADLTDPEDDCGCPDESVSHSHRQYRDMPSWDAGR